MDSKAAHEADGLPTTEEGGTAADPQPLSSLPNNNNNNNNPSNNADDNPADPPDDGNDRAARNNNHKKRKRQGHDAYQDAYRGFTFAPVPSTGRPGTPHRFFAESYTVQYEPPLSCDGDRNHVTTRSKSIVTSVVRQMRVHRHANGLCVIATTKKDSMVDHDDDDDARNNHNTVDDHRGVLLEEKGGGTTPKTLQWCCSPIPDLSAAQKRKQISSMLKQKQPNQSLPPGAVRPMDPLVTIQNTAKHNDKVTFPAVVFGSVLELHTELTMDLLRRDPLLKGYLAVILPSGPFPPPPPPQST